MSLKDQQKAFLSHRSNSEVSPGSAFYDKEPVVDMEVEEKDGPVRRRIYLMPFSRENLQELFYRARMYPVLFGHEISNDFTKFCGVFLGQTDTGEIYPKGIAYSMDNFLGSFFITNITGTEADIHYSFFDGSVRGRLPLAKRVLRFVFEKYGFHRLNTQVAEYAKEATHVFVHKMGFVYEGSKRRAIRHWASPHIWKRQDLYGILKDEVIKNERRTN